MPVITFAGQQAYLASARSVGLRWRGYLAFVAAPIGVVLVAVLSPPFALKQFYAGFAVGSVVMMLAISVTGFANPKTSGHLAETFSLESLRKVSGWTVIENLPFDGVDVDHVVITPSGVLAVESKYFGPVAEGSTYERERIAAACRAAEASARKVRSLLRARKLHETVTVTPVLMVWGPGAPTFVESHRVRGEVYVVQAEHPRLWSHLFLAPIVSSADRARVRTAFGDYLAKKRAHDALNTTKLRTRIWHEFRQGMHAERAARAMRANQLGLLRRRHGRRDPGRSAVLDPLRWSCRASSAPRDRSWTEELSGPVVPCEERPPS